MGLVALLPFLLASCEGAKSEDVDTYTYWVNSSRVPCMGVAPMECLQIRKGDDPAWQLFYSDIEGFEYEPGYLYRLRVREEKRDPESVPADASSIRFVLVEVVEKKPDPDK
jgi:hypothetical protein